MRAGDKATARPLEEWHEDMGDCLWWCWDEEASDWLDEAPYVGTPLDAGIASGFRLFIMVGRKTQEHIEAINDVAGWPGYHTHFTPLPEFPEPPNGHP